MLSRSDIFDRTDLEYRPLEVERDQFGDEIAGDNKVGFLKVTLGLLLIALVASLATAIATFMLLLQYDVPTFKFTFASSLLSLAASLFGIVWSSRSYKRCLRQ